MNYSLFYIGTMVVSLCIYLLSKRIGKSTVLLFSPFLALLTLISFVYFSGWFQDLRFGLSMVSFAMWSIVWFFQDKEKDGRFFFPFTVYHLLVVPIGLLIHDKSEIIIQFPVLQEIRTFLANYLIFILLPAVTFGLVKMVQDKAGHFSKTLLGFTFLFAIVGIIGNIFLPFGIVFPIVCFFTDTIWLILIFKILATEFQTKFQISFNRLGILALVLMMLVDDFSLFFDTLGNLLGLPSVGKENSYVRFYLNQVPQLFILSYFFIDYRIRKGFGIKLAKSNLD